MKHSKSTARILFLSVLASYSALAETTPVNFSLLAGNWHGTVHQKNTNSTYTVDLTLKNKGNAGDIVGTSDYKTLGCGGNLEMVHKIGQTLVVREVLTHGQAMCLDNVLLYLTPDKDRKMRYAFFESGQTPEDVPNGLGFLDKIRK